MTTAIVRTAGHEQHAEPGHVEIAARLAAIDAALADSELLPDLLEVAPHPASEAAILAVHDARMVERLRAAASRSAWLTLDTYTTRGSWDVARVAAGAALTAVEAVLGGQAHNAFALGRPPGHHATPEQSMGFCLLNNIAIAARHALRSFGLERVAIVDYDVHHGNGTQDIFYQDQQVLFCSTHAYGRGFYPGSGAVQEQGAGAGLGYTLNVPLPFGADDAGLQHVFEQTIAPALRRFKPQLILVSAGYDAHWADPLGPLALSVAGYAGLTGQLLDLAGELCDGRLVLVLEGGYDLRALGCCVVAALRVLLGRDAGPDPLGPARSQAPDLHALVAMVRQSHPLLAP